MIQLAVRGIVRQFDRAPVLDGVSFDLRPGEKVGLVGPNGAGKTTLFGILAGRDEPDQGTVEKHSSVRIAVLDQEAPGDNPRTLIEEAREGLASLYALHHSAEEAAHGIATETDSVERERWQRKFDSAQVDLQRLDGYNLEHRVVAVLEGLGFVREQFDKPLVQLSGGQRNRATLARVLLAAPDILLLDEPTNHLDVAATEWLEGYLKDCPQTLLVISHDRYFLDRVTERTLELFSAQLTDYPGNFSQYWRLKKERQELQQKTFEKQQEFIAKTEEFIRKNFYSKSSQSHDREKKLERLERVEQVREIPMSAMGFGKPRRTGDWVIWAEGLTKGFDHPLFENVDLQVPRGQRLGLFGPNGSGKTTLLRTLLGELEPDAGKIRFGTNVDVAYFDQQLKSVDPELDCIEAIRPPNNPQILPAQLRDVLAKFGLKGEIVFQKVGNLSGGEKSKVALARIATLNCNVLVLDEPTNHLDLWARASLEASLKEFEGTILFVSHDRYFIDQTADALFVFEADRWRLYGGNYSAYVDSRRREREEAAALTSAASKVAAPVKPREDSPKPAKRKRTFPYRKVHDIEADIARCEARFEEVEADLSRPEVMRDAARAKETSREYEELQAKIAQLYEHWDEASELN